MKWQGSSVGPDWMDIARAMAHTEETYTCVCSFTITQMSKQNRQSFWIGVVATTPVFTEEAQLLSVEISDCWPDADHKTLEGKLYSMLLRADYELEQKFAQLGMPIA